MPECWIEAQCWEKGDVLRSEARRAPQASHFWTPDHHPRAPPDRGYLHRAMQVPVPFREITFWFEL